MLHAREAVVDAASLATRPLRAPVPVRFPEEDVVPETKRHLVLRTLLFQLLRHALAHRASIGSDQFVYWNASDPRRCVAPDAFVRLGAPDGLFGSWKTWERGAPELCVEIVSDSDAAEAAWASRLARYHELGVQELVRFDPEAPASGRIRVWDRREDDLVERLVEADETPCAVLGLLWRVRPGDGEDAALRLTDLDGELLLTPAEAAERRVAELEAELARRGG